MTALSIVIPTYQRREGVIRALTALAEQTADPDTFEVIISIDGSTDGTREAVERFHAPYRLRVLWHPNRGRAAARNAGAEEAVGEVLVFLDDDMEPLNGFVQGHLRAHPPGSRRAVVGPVPIPARPGCPPLVTFRSLGFEAKLSRLAQANYRPMVRDLYSGNLSVPRTLFWEAGGFDEAFGVYGHEDFDLVLRLQALGIELGFAEDAGAVQYYEKHLGELASNILEEGQTAVLFAVKHPQILHQLELSTWMERSTRHRAALTTLLASTRLLPALQGMAIRAVKQLEKMRPQRLQRYYGLLFEYLFWLGADRALRAHGLGPGWRLSPRLGLAAIAASRGQHAPTVDQARTEPSAGAPAARASSNAE
jgi:glycosyltransferase involved in cell wall biosynthesis